MTSALSATGSSLDGVVLSVAMRHLRRQDQRHTIPEGINRPLLRLGVAVAPRPKSQYCP